MENALKEIAAALAVVNSTGFEVGYNANGCSVTIYGVREGAPKYACKSKQALGTGKTLNVAFTKALKLFTETK